MNDDKDKREEKEKGMPIIVIKDKENKLRRARVVQRKGVHPYATDRIKKDIEQFGYKKIIFKCDQENSIKALKYAIKEATNTEIKMEESPVGEHQANGDVESAINDIKGQQGVRQFVEQQGYVSMLQMSRWDHRVSDIIFRKMGLTH